MEDEKIVAMFLRRDESALACTAEKYGPKLRALANNLLHNSQDAEECENDTYLQAWNAIPPHEPGAYFFPFLAKITRRMAINVCRTRYRKKRNAPLAQLTRELEQCIPAKGDTQGQVDGLLLGEEISRYLRGLPEEPRDMFIRRYWYLEPVAQVAKRFGAGQSKVKTSLYRTRQGLREYLIKEGYDL
ncbi:RNA polymerase sigma factor [Acutalibacter caecimuris]|uniref:RNA polymerase sigma factor n=1 Tax=Acutalibacter caecimuris TaxID=3093657 RepID=UPI002AC9201A|nr:RNA polymerase sigma factor [Acutalibacter sp. M00118]